MDNPYTLQSLVALTRTTYSSIIEKIKGMKVLVLDSDTSGMISLVHTHSYLLENEVLLTLKIDDGTVFNSGNLNSNLRHLKSLYILQPTMENVLKLSNELQNPHFKEYYLFFTNEVNKEFLELIAKGDSLELVKGVYEYFVDFYVISDTLFTLNIKDSSGLYAKDVNFMLNPTVSRIVKSIYSLSCLVNQIPTVVCKKGNMLLQTISSRIQAEYNNNTLNLQAILQSYGVYNRECAPATSGCVLLIMDRREDCVTPLLNQWTYQAMIHELIGMNGMNRVSIGGSDYILNDDFYGKHVYTEFADVESALDVLIKESKSGTTDVFRMVENLPTQSKMVNETSRHVTILHELARIIQEKGLLKSGLLEQDLVSKRANFQEVVDLIGGKVDVKEKIRVALLTALRNQDKIGKVKDYLRMNGLEGEMSIVDKVVNMSTEVAKQAPEFGISLFGRKDSESPYLQHKSQLYTTLHKIIKGKLEPEAYTIVPSAYDLGYTLKSKPASIMVFIIGGATFAESRDCSIVTRETGIPVVLGGTFIHNSETFLETLPSI
ncbi:sorting-associated vesicle protein, putative [Theileria equi strain WA]|uniref:Sorting-associated vesicle protein, putative n=1 Tax=Theileria equi strain WA TaxID=1537102 RepID=L1LE01_THEEQ|nr:sorting-associated vesicle protein, putative [Theileria equi strain WA]EKX73378.1 sorting-associated vesicle protein, putative [Theileria equi strain WA]|eukprot:XP_004832830.1 sorting-associated vesicle protein, putative [Theileria equi strain WA]